MQTIVNRGVSKRTETIRYPFLGCGRELHIIAVINNQSIPVKRLKVAAEICSFDDLQKTLDGLEEWLINEYDRVIDP